MAHGAPLESAFCEVLGEDDQTGPECVHGLIEADNSSAHAQQMEGDWESLIPVWDKVSSSPFHMETQVSVKAVIKFLKLVAPT